MRFINFSSFCIDHGYQSHTILSKASGISRTVLQRMWTGRHRVYAQSKTILNLAAFFRMASIDFMEQANVRSRYFSITLRPIYPGEKIRTHPNRRQAFINLRVEHGWSVRTLAKAVGIRFWQLAKWEEGYTKELPQQIINRIYAVMNLSLDAMKKVPIKNWIHLVKRCYTEVFQPRFLAQDVYLTFFAKKIWEEDFKQKLMLGSLL